MIRELHWTGILFGAATGLVASMALFALSGRLGTNLIVLLVAATAGFISAGFIAGRLSLVHEIVAGRIASLLQFFALATFMVVLGTNPNILGLLLLGVLAMLGGTVGARWSKKRRAS